MLVAKIIRRAGVGVLAGIVGGVIAGVGARIAMRLIADAIGKVSEFTVAGTLNVLIIGVFIGIAFGLVFVAMKRFIPGSGLAQAFIFGVLLLVVFGLPMLIPARGELTLAPGNLGKYLFGSLFVVYGVVIGVAEGWIDRFIPAPRRQFLSLMGYGLLMALGVIGLALFSGSFVATVFGVAQ